MGALQGARADGTGRVPGARGVAYFACGLIAAFLLAGCGLVERLTEDAPPKKAATAESQAAEGEAAESGAEPETPVATLPPSDDPRLILRVPFEPGEAALSVESQVDLDLLARSLPGNPAATPEIFGYWSAASEDPSRAKTFALKRGTVVRNYLKQHGAMVPRIRLLAVSDPDPDLVDLLRPLR